MPKAAPIDWRWRNPVEHYLRLKSDPDIQARALEIDRTEDAKRAFEIIIRELKITDELVSNVILWSCAELSLPTGKDILTRELAASAEDAARSLGRLLSEEIGRTDNHVAAVLRKTHSRNDVPPDAEILAALSAVADYFSIFKRPGRKFPDLGKHALLLRLDGLLFANVASKNTKWIDSTIRLLMRATFGEWKPTDLSTRKIIERIKRDNELRPVRNK